MAWPKVISVEIQFFQVIHVAVVLLITEIYSMVVRFFSKINKYESSMKFTNIGIAIFPILELIPDSYLLPSCNTIWKSNLTYSSYGINNDKQD